MSRNVYAIGSVVAAILAWTWALVAGVGGLALLIRQGPTFSGVAACPLTAQLLKKHAGVTVPWMVQAAAALLIFIARRVAVAVLLHRPSFRNATEAAGRRRRRPDPPYGPHSTTGGADDYRLYYVHFAKANQSR